MGMLYGFTHFKQEPALAMSTQISRTLSVHCLGSAMFLCRAGHPLWVMSILGHVRYTYIGMSI